MLKLIIADDETVIRESISNLIDWNSHGFELVGQCENGMEAYDMILDEDPDIVLTDIMMPGFNGIELIEKIRGINEEIEFVILSGYSEFEFAQKAMKYGVSDYLLKPCNEEQILQAIESAKQNYLKKKERSLVYKQNQLLSSHMDAVLKKQMIIESLTTNDLDFTLNRYLANTNLNATKHILFYVSFLEEKHLSLFIQEVNKILDIKQNDESFIFLYVKNTVLIIAQCKKEINYEQLSCRLAAIQFLQQQVTLFCKREDYSCLPDLLRILVPKLKRFSKILLINKDGTRQELYNYITVFQEIDKFSQTFYNRADKLKKNELPSFIHSLFSAVSDIQLARIFCIELFNKFCSLDAMNSKKVSSLTFLEKLSHCVDIPSIETLTLSTIITMSDAEGISCYRSFISKTIKYVEDHYYEANLSLKWIAENYLFMNVDYLSREFVKETGEKFSSFLMRTRMEHAQVLLKKYGEEKIYAVAEQVGCGNNPQYFSHLFKKHTGLSPTAYMEQYGI